MSVTVLPYLTEVSAASSAPASTKQTTGETNTNFKDVLDAATSAQQKMAVDALIAASGSGFVSVSTVQKILGFNPQYTVSSTQTPVATTQETANNTLNTDSASATSSTTGTTQTAKTTTSDSDKDSLGCPSELEPYFKEAAEKYNVDVNLLKAIAKAESNFNPNAVSSAGALGVMQLMPSTASSLGISNAYNAKAVKEAFSWNPGFREYFAVKATPNPYILKILQEYDMGCDCSSYTELMLSKSCGFDGKHIMFSSNDTPAEEFAYADKLGAIINLDDFTHIDFLEETIGHIPETISCRYNPGGVFELSNGIMDNPGDSKYGMTKDQLIEAFKILKSKGAKYFGVHAFLASNTVTNEYYPKLAGELFELIVELKEKTGCDIKFVNLSGGVGIPYTPDKEPNDIRVIGEGVHKKFDEILVPAGLGDVSIYTEMGRFMLGPYGCLVTKAIHEKHIYKEYIGVDACAANLMRPAIYGAYHHITVLGKENAPCDQTYDVTGSLCENCDKFAVDRKLPKIDMGDYLVIHDTGAHGFSMGYNYNGRLRSAELLLKEDGSVQMIRRAETPADYFATFDCFDDLKITE